MRVGAQQQMTQLVSHDMAQEESFGKQSSTRQAFHPMIVKLRSAGWLGPHDSGKRNLNYRCANSDPGPVDLGQWQNFEYEIK
jgi:hypothetical protein